MDNSAKPDMDAAVSTTEGDELRFCRTCTFSSACLDSGYDKLRLQELHVLVRHTPVIPRGATIYHEGQPFSAIAAVRNGAVKTSVTDSGGREQVQGFFLPGEVIGLNAIADGRYPCDVIALQDTVLCQISFTDMAELAAKMPALQGRLFSLLSADIGRASLLAGDFPARERIAMFLLTMVKRQAQRRPNGALLRLAMPWSDVASYLRLVPETVSRQIKALQDEGLVDIDRREVRIQNLRALEAIAGDILRSRPTGA